MDEQNTSSERDGERNAPVVRTPLGTFKHSPNEIAAFYRFPVDHSVHCHGRIQNLPPPMHPRRCQSTNRHREQCTLWATRGDNVCHFHKKRGALYASSRLKGFYTRRAGPVLREKIEELEATALNEKLSLEGEVDMARILAERAIALFERACIDPDGVAKSSQETKAMAISAARSALTHVSNLVAEASKTRLINNEVLDTRGVDFVIAQVLEILEKMVRPLVGDEVMTLVIDAFKAIRVPDNSKLHIVVQ